MTQGTVDAIGELSGPAGRVAAAPGSVHRILRNSTLSLVAQALVALSNLVVVVALARGLDKAAFGSYWLLFALITVVQLVVEAGISTVLTCRIAQAPDGWRKTVAEATGLFTLIVLGSATAFVGLGAAVGWYQGDRSLLPAYAAAGVACAAIQGQRFGAGVARGFEDFNYENLSKILQGAAYAGLVVVVVVAGLGSLFSVVAALAASHVLAALFLISCVQWRWRCLAWRLDGSVLKNWLAEAVPLGFGDLVRGLTWQLDTVLLGILRSAAEVGIYSVAYRPLGPLNWLPRTVLWACFPSFARMAAGDRDALDRAFGHSVRLLWIVSVPLAVAICLCAEPLILLLAGPTYLEAVVPMRILIWISTLSFLSIQYRFLFTAVGRQRTFAVLVVVVFAIELALEAALVPWWGYFGSCAGSMVGELVFTVAGLWICRRLGGAQIDWKALAWSALAGAVMAGLLWPVRSSPLPLLVPAVALATLVYFVLCVLLGALRRDEVWHLYEALARRRPAADSAPAAGDPSRDRFAEATLANGATQRPAEH